MSESARTTRPSATSPGSPPLIGALMRMPVDAVYQRMIDDAHAAGFTELVPAHFAVLRYPGPDGRRPSDLAHDAGMSKQAMNYLLGQLEEFGYVRRDDDPDDRRSKLIRLTDSGERLKATIRRTVTTIENDLEADLGTRTYTDLRRLLERLNRSPTLGLAEDPSPDASS